MTRPLTVVFMPESAYGPTNNCIGLGNLLLQRGHRVVFVAETSWRGRLEPLGFEEELVDLSEPAGNAGAQDAGAFWTEFIEQTAPEFRKPTIEQLDTFVRPTWQALIDGAVYCEPQLREILGRVRPDVVVEDNVVGFASLLTCGAPYVRIVSCNPLEMPGPDVPPVFSGLPSGDRSEWQAFRDEYDRTHRAMWTRFNAWMVDQGAPPLDDLRFVHSSQRANLYVFPAEADYLEARPLDTTWHRIDSSVRETESDYDLPEPMRAGRDGSALVYLSLGSLGSADVELMQRLVDAFAQSRHRFIVSMGPRHTEIRLAANMVGASTLPQPKVIPQVDVVVTHGGNNTTTEALHFGKPMLVLPLFWDQYDNAQRVDELGFGRRMATYDATADQLRNALDGLAADEPLRHRMAEIGARIRGRQGLRRAADLIERVGREQADSGAG